MHEELEAETIKTSSFRHKMTFFNFDFKKEIEENVKAARDSNMAVIVNLKEKSLLSLVGTRTAVGGQKNLVSFKLL